MTAAQQRVAIAEACGWRFIERSPRGKIWAPPSGQIRYCLEAQLPDYLNDLNAMHEAERTLSGENKLGLGSEHSAYMLALERVVARGGIPSGWSWALLHATAAQRAEAFLRTIGKWKDAA